MGYSEDYRSADSIVVDIETCGLPNAADYLEPVTPDARLKDPAKIADDIAAKTVTRQDKLALDWNVGRIMALGWWTERDGFNIRMCPSEINEETVLAEFWHETKGRTIIGFNLKGFDLRFLIQRSRLLRVDHPMLDLSKYSRKGIIDLYLDLTFGDGHYDQGAMRRTLHAFCRRFGIPVDDQVQGKDVPALVAAGDWAAVEAHCRADVEATVALAQRLGVIPVMEAQEA